MPIPRCRTWLLAALLLAGTADLAAPAQAQSDAQARLQHLRCAQMGNGLMGVADQTMLQRCLRGAGTPGPRLAGPMPQLVHPVGPLVGNPGPRGPSGAGDGCRQGWVWREAAPGDHVCVSPATRRQARDANASAASRVNQVDHSYGPDTCQGGFVWREATPGNHVCVPPAIRTQARQDNDAAAGRRAH